MKPTSKQTKKPLVPNGSLNELTRQEANQMQVLPSDNLNSNYKGKLASEKYFTPQELHNLARVGKSKRPPSGGPRMPVVQKELKKAEPTQMAASSGFGHSSSQNGLRDSQTSFYSTQEPAPLGLDQQEKLKKLAKPFSITAKK